MNHLLTLYARNRDVAGRRFAVEALAGAGEATVYLYDVIAPDDETADWCGGVSPRAFAETLADISAQTIHLRVNSPGGSVFGGRAMATALREKQKQCRVVAHVDGLAASAASFVMLAAGEVEMADGAMVMVHKGWTWAMGNADELRTTAALLDKVDGTLVDTYARETGQTPAQIQEWMAAETWFTAQEAVDAGFADRLAVEQDADAQARAIAWDLSAYTRAPKIAAATPAQRNRITVHVDVTGMEEALAAARQIAAALQDDHAAVQPTASADHRSRQQQRVRALSLTPNR